MLRTITDRPYHPEGVYSVLTPSVSANAGARAKGRAETPSYTFLHEKVQATSHLLIQARLHLYEEENG